MKGLLSFLLSITLFGVTLAQTTGSCFQTDKYTKNVDTSLSFYCKRGNISGTFKAQYFIYPDKKQSLKYIFAATLIFTPQNGSLTLQLIDKSGIQKDTTIKVSSPLPIVIISLNFPNNLDTDILASKNHPILITIPEDASQITLTQFDDLNGSYNYTLENADTETITAVQNRIKKYWAGKRKRFDDSISREYESLKRGMIFYQDSVITAILLNEKKLKDDTAHKNANESIRGKLKKRFDSVFKESLGDKEDRVLLSECFS